MILDKNGLIIMEQDNTLAGNTGDSCAETSRMVTLQMILGLPIKSNTSLFLTNNGVTRYPSTWAPSDTSSDQVIPLLPALSTAGRLIVLHQVYSAGIRTGNGELATWPLICQLMRSIETKGQTADDLCLVLQALVFILPIAFNPQATINPLTWFIRNVNQTANYLNFINMLAFAKMQNPTILSKLAMKLCKQSTALAAVQSYYKPEPNSQWLIDLYIQALPKIWS